MAAKVTLDVLKVMRAGRREAGRPEDREAYRSAEHVRDLGPAGATGAESPVNENRVNHEIPIQIATEPSDEFDLARLRQRLDGYLMSHQIGLHTTVMSIALAVGGLALASLLGTARLYRDQYPLLWMLWLASMLACFVVYNSMSTSAYALPSKVPSGLDLLPPLAIGAFEFLLFAVLAHQATGLNRTSLVIEVWFLSFTGFALTSVGALIRADYLFKVTKYQERLKPTIIELRKVLHIDTVAAACLAVVALAAGVSEASRQAPTPVLYALAVVIILGLLIAPIGHAHRVGTVRRMLAADSRSRNVIGDEGRQEGIDYEQRAAGRDKERKCKNSRLRARIRHLHLSARCKNGDNVTTD